MNTQQLKNEVLKEATQLLTANNLVHLVSGIEVEGNTITVWTKEGLFQESKIVAGYSNINFEGIICYNVGNNEKWAFLA